MSNVLQWLSSNLSLLSVGFGAAAAGITLTTFLKSYLADRRKTQLTMSIHQLKSHQQQLIRLGANEKEILGLINQQREELRLLEDRKPEKPVSKSDIAGDYKE